MTLEELLKKHFGEDADKLNAFVEDMKTNKIYTSNEENIDIRYGKLKGNYDALVTKEQEAQSLIEELKKSTKNDEESQNKINEYEAQIAELTKQNEALTIDNNLKFELLAKGAKASDIDYLVYRAKNSDKALELDKEGNIKGLDTIIEELQKTCTGNFEEKAKKKVIVKDLPNPEKDEKKITKEQFDKMGYNERNKLYQEDKELYETLKKGEE